MAEMGVFAPLTGPNHNILDRYSARNPVLSLPPLYDIFEKGLLRTTFFKEGCIRMPDATLFLLRRKKCRGG